jgi:hypothetical protein
MAELHDVLDEIVRLLGVRQEAKDEVHDLIDQLREGEAASARQAARKAATGKPGDGEKA